jgi:hypothetical protein
MRFVSILLLLCLAACSGNPHAYGITGPVKQEQPPEQPDDADVGSPGIPASGTPYSTGVTPTTGATRFWGYN